MDNTSGQGALATVPEEIKKWNWGAFFLSWIWGIGNKTYIALLCLIPYVGFVMAIVLGVKGNEWAWRNKQWESIEQFQRVQKKWAIWAVVFVLGVIILGMAVAVLITLIRESPNQ